MSPTAIIYECADFFEAEAIRMRLAATGIPAFVGGDDAASSMAISGGRALRAIVFVKVHLHNLTAATEILEQDRLRGAALGAWTCSTCSETNESTFELCWNCGTTRHGIDNVIPLRPLSPPTAERGESSATRRTYNPYRASLIDSNALPYLQWTSRLAILAFAAAFFVTLLVLGAFVLYH